MAIEMSTAEQRVRRMGGDTRVEQTKKDIDLR